MNLQQFVLDIYARLSQELEGTISGLTPEQLHYQPQPDANSIGWLIWHTSRGQDRMNADLFGEDQLWVSAKWYEKFNRLPDPKDTGMGHSPAQVAAFRAPDARALSDYYRAVSERTKAYIDTRLDDNDLGRQVKSPTLGTTSTVEQRLLGGINNLQHIGQAGYIRGLFSGIGWYGR